MVRKRTGRVHFLVLLRLWTGPPQNNNYYYYYDRPNLPGPPGYQRRRRDSNVNEGAAGGTAVQSAQEAALYKF